MDTYIDRHGQEADHLAAEADVPAVSVSFCLTARLSVNKLYT